jgi:hypothetical protein
MNLIKCRPPEEIRTIYCILFYLVSGAILYSFLNE